MRKCVLVGNPVVSLENTSVFAKKEGEEQIAKKRVRYLYSLVLSSVNINRKLLSYRFLLDTLFVTFTLLSTLAMEMFKLLIHKNM